MQKARELKRKEIRKKELKEKFNISGTDVTATPEQKGRWLHIEQKGNWKKMQAPWVNQDLMRNKDSPLMNQIENESYGPAKDIDKSKIYWVKNDSAPPASQLDGQITQKYIAHTNHKNNVKKNNYCN